MSWFSRKKDNIEHGLSPEVARIFEKVHQFLSDETLQNEKLPEGLKAEINWNASVDVVPGAWGEFGRDLNNPIPVNGPLGEVLYLSSLKRDDGRRIAFQRLGSVNKVDIFETVTFDGRLWDLLFLCMYYPRKSKLCPKGYLFFEKEHGRAWLRGVNDFADEFPAGIVWRTVEFCKRRLGLEIADPDLKSLERVAATRPARHIALLSQLQLAGRLERG